MQKNKLESFCEKIKKIKIGNILGFIFIFVIVMASPIVLKKGILHLFSKKWLSLLDGGILTTADHDSWASFFGSYLGGVFGGVATLIAVIMTISNNKDEIEHKANEEKKERIGKSALIIYYDFKFVLENIDTFLDEFRTKRVGTDESDVYESFNLGKYKDKRDVLDQLYFDSNWIRTVADLYESENSKSHNIGSAEIKTIYEIYGHFMTIVKSVYSNDRRICKNAFEAMKKIKAKEPDVKIIMSELKKIAEIPEDNSVAI